MNETLEMTITISAVATPSLYRTLTSIANPRQRAAFLKRIADDYLRGQSIPPASDVGQTLEPIAELALRDDEQEVRAKAVKGNPDTAPPNPAKSPAVQGDDDHYDFLESNLSGYQ